MRIFLLGATGPTGNHVLKRLVSENHFAKVLLRDPRKLSIDDLGTKPEQVTIIEGSVAETEKIIDGLLAY